MCVGMGVCAESPDHYYGAFVCPVRHGRGHGRLPESPDHLYACVCVSFRGYTVPQQPQPTLYEYICLCVCPAGISQWILSSSIGTRLCVLGVSLHTCMCPVRVNRTQQVLARAGTWPGACVLRVAAHAPLVFRACVNGGLLVALPAHGCARAGSQAGVRADVSASERGAARLARLARLRAARAASTLTLLGCYWVTRAGPAPCLLAPRTHSRRPPRSR